MKKHVFGFAVFAVIVTVALVADDFMTPEPMPTVVPSISTIDLPASNGKRDNFGDLSVVMKSSPVYDADESKLRANVVLEWRGAGEPPKMVYVQPRIYVSSNLNTSVALPGKLVTDPFAGGKSTVVEFESSSAIGRAKNDNLYLTYSVKAEPTNELLTNPEGGATSATQVIVKKAR